MNKLIYVASPYSENPFENFKKALDFVNRHYFNTGEVLFSPIIYGHTLASNDEIGQVFGINTGFECWREFDLLMLSKSDELWVLKLDGWERSEGVKAEIEFAKNNNIKVRYIELKESETIYLTERAKMSTNFELDKNINKEEILDELNDTIELLQLKKKLTQIESELDKSRTSTYDDGWQTQRFAKKSRRWDILAQERTELRSKILELEADLTKRNINKVD